jgi:hypothetical protein
MAPKAHSDLAAMELARPISETHNDPANVASRLLARPISETRQIDRVWAALILDIPPDTNWCEYMGFHRIMADPKDVAIYGVWQALVKLGRVTPEQFLMASARRQEKEFFKEQCDRMERDLGGRSGYLQYLHDIGFDRFNWWMLGDPRDPDGETKLIHEAPRPPAPWDKA